MSEKLKARLFLLGVAIILGTLSYFCFLQAESIGRQNHRTANGVVYEKFETQRGHYKSSRISNEFVMVIKEDNGHYFDLTVTPSTYATHKIGDRISFSNIRLESLGEKEKGGGLAWILGSIIIAVLGMTALIMMTDV